MSELEITPLASASQQTPHQGARAGSTGSALSFQDVLSSLNPLQYFPVVGTLYRALTGDQIPEPMRRVGSLIVSGLLGGPIGAAINAATIAAEKITNINLDEVGQTLLAGRDPTRARDEGTAPATAEAAPAAASTAAEEKSSPATDPRQPWSPVQLAAYGVDTAGNGTPRLGRLSGAEALNEMELSRVQRVGTAAKSTPAPAESTSADALNDLELTRVRMAQSAYDQAIRLQQAAL